MPTLRADGELREARRRLFETLPQDGTAGSLMRFQKSLRDEIVATEMEHRSAPSDFRRAHLEAVRQYGDALAHTVLSAYSIRQLARNAGRPPYLTDQAPAIELAMSCAEHLASAELPTMVCDLTNVLRVGDLVICADPDLPKIIECKAPGPRKRLFERQGRRGRQMAAAWNRSRASSVTVTGPFSGKRSPG